MIIERHFETLKKMFFEEGIRQLTVDIVCSRIGIAKKTFYKDFANRRELVDALFHKEFFGFRQELTLALNKGHDAIEKLCTFFEFLSARQDSLSYQTLMDLNEHYQPLNSEIMRLENRLIIEVTSTILAQGISESVFRENIISEHIGGVFAFLFMTGIVMRKNNVRQDLFSFSDTSLVDFHMRSICTPLGMKLWTQKYPTVDGNATDD